MSTTQLAPFPLKATEPIVKSEHYISDSVYGTLPPECMYEDLFPTVFVSVSLALGYQTFETILRGCLVSGYAESAYSDNFVIELDECDRIPHSYTLLGSSFYEKDGKQYIVTDHQNIFSRTEMIDTGNFYGYDKAFDSKNLIFRRVKKTITKTSDFVSATRYTDKGRVFYKTPGHFYNSTTPDVRSKQCKIIYKKFFGMTHTTSRKKDEYDGMSISYDLKDYDEEILSSIGLPLGLGGKCQRPPEYRDLVCGFVEISDKKLRYTKWCRVSEQFYKLWNLVHNKTYIRELPKKNKAHSITASLVTNNAKWRPTENTGQYYVTTERMSRAYGGIYTAFARYIVFNQDIRSVDLSQRMFFEAGANIVPDEFYDHLELLLA